MLRALKTYIKGNFGSSSGLVNSVKYKTLYNLGLYRRYQDIDFGSVQRLVFVCAGNICRSPFGEYIAKAKGLEAVSYGLHCRGGDRVDPRALREASFRGVDMSGHITQNIANYQSRNGDLLLVMEPGHLLHLSESLLRQPQVTILSLWTDHPTPYLNDPFSANEEFFSRCESVVEQSVNNIHAKLNNV